MKLKNVLIVVKDIERARQFYHDLFGLELILDNDGSAQVAVPPSGVVIEKKNDRPKAAIVMFLGYCLSSCSYFF